MKPEFLAADEPRDSFPAGSFGTVVIPLVPEPELSISIVIPAYNAAAFLGSCLTHIQNARAVAGAGSAFPLECIVVDDGSTDSTVMIAEQFGAAVHTHGGRGGPAIARNRGAAAASGDILLFLDADVCVNDDVIARIRASFLADPELDAIIGSYDDSPQAPDFLSRYRNLMHCYVHRHGRRRASTFWSGCGAIRRRVFLEAGGFDESYGRPSIEDIELGSRLVASGHKIELDPSIMVKHLKHWSLVNMVRTDIRDRAIPWTELILRNRSMPNDLNLRVSQRLSVVLVTLLAPAAILALGSSGQGFALTICILFYLAFARLSVSEDFTRKPNRILAMAIPGAAIIFLAFATGSPWLIAMIAGAHMLLHTSLWLLRRAERTSAGKPGSKQVKASSVFRFLFALCAGTIMLFALVRFRHPSLYVFYAILTPLILLNLDFYNFLGEKMGKLHAIAAIPFHLLFHFYSGVSFCVALIRYFAGNGGAVPQLLPLKPEPASAETSRGL